MVAVDKVEAEAGQGLVGDASFGRGKRQVLIIESESLANFELAPGQVRENLTISGLTLAGQPPGAQIRAGEALLEVTGDCAPCRFLDDIRDGLQRDMAGQRGTLCRVINGGAIHTGDEILVVSSDAV
jgi:MOSC domain-containing protein YiiM